MPSFRIRVVDCKYKSTIIEAVDEEAARERVESQTDDQFGWISNDGEWYVESIELLAHD